MTGGHQVDAHSGGPGQTPRQLQLRYRVLVKSLEEEVLFELERSRSPGFYLPALSAIAEGGDLWHPFYSWICEAHGETPPVMFDWRRRHRVVDLYRMTLLERYQAWIEGLLLLIRHEDNRNSMGLVELDKEGMDLAFDLVRPFFNWIAELRGRTEGLQESGQRRLFLVQGVGRE